MEPGTNNCGPPAAPQAPLGGTTSKLCPSARKSGEPRDEDLSSQPQAERRHTRRSGISVEALIKQGTKGTGKKDSFDTQEELVQAIQEYHQSRAGEKSSPPRKLRRVGSTSPSGLLSVSSPSPSPSPSPSHPKLHDPPPAQDNMATRNKPRPGYASKDDHGDKQEEQALWNQIQADLRKCAAVQKKQIAATERIREIYDLINKNPSKAPAKLYEEMDSLTREVLKLTQEEQKLLHEEPTDIIRNVEILQALRAASSNDTGRAASPAARVAKDKQRKKAGSGSGKFDGPDGLDSPGPSPIATGRLKSSGRSSSVAGGRDAKEASVKAEDGETGGSRQTHASEGSKGPSAEKAGKFFEGADVAYKQAKPKEDGSQWIQCIIVSITERNGKKRYEVQDPEPDETGAPGDIYTASASALIAIPPAEADLPELPVGKAVLARYPETTTFYRAEVTGHVASKSLCRLKFEDDQNQEMEVPLRFVLSLDK
jgi:SAGA-associated factor 29